MQKGFSVVIVLVGILALLGVGIGSYYFGKQANVQVGQQVVNSPVPTVLPDQKNKASDGEIYSNSKYRYSINVPDNYSIAECSNGDSVNISTTQQGLECETEPAGIGIGVFDSAETENNIAVIKRDYTVSEEAVNANGLAGLKLVGKLFNKEAPLPHNLTVTYFESNNLTVAIYYNDFGNTGEAPIYSQIVQSFKFN